MKEEKSLRLKRLGARIKIARTTAKITQAKLAERVGIEETEVWRIETGQVEMKVLTYLDICNVLSLD